MTSLAAEPSIVGLSVLADADGLMIWYAFNVLRLLPNVLSRFGDSGAQPARPFSAAAIINMLDCASNVFMTALLLKFNPGQRCSLYCCRRCIRLHWCCLCRFAFHFSMKEKFLA